MDKIEKDLSLVSMNELMAEIASRHDAFVFMGYRNNSAQGDYSSLKNHKGNNFLCMGLAHHLMNDFDVCIRRTISPDNR